jgi:hypothetical protein
MIVEDIVRRFAFQRPEATLVGYEEVALPYWRLRVRGFVLERKRIDPIAEFVLKAINAGLQTEEEISNFLGLRGEILRGEMSELLRSEDIYLTAGQGGRHHVWAQTMKGRTTLEEAETVLPEEQSFDIDFDGILRIVCSLTGETYAPRQLRDFGWLEIPPSPPTAPELSDLRFTDVAQTLRMKVARPRELLWLTGIERRTRLFRPGILLVYQSKTTRALESSFIIGGKLAEEYANAFARSGGQQRLGLDEPPKKQLDNVARLLLPDDLRKQMPKIEEVDATRELVAAAEEHLAKAREEANQASGSVERTEAHQNIIKAQCELDAANQALTSLPVRHLAVYDHPPLLNEALTDAKTRLLILSPWISACVVNTEFLNKLDHLLARGVDVYIGYGIGDNRDCRESEADKKAKDALSALATRRKNLRFKDFGNTHAKILAYDHKWCIATSFNWLSFRGDRNRGYRDEQGFLVSSPYFVEETFAKQMSAFGVSRTTETT